MKLKLDRTKTEQPITHPQVRVLLNDIIGATIVIGAEYDILTIKASDLLDFIKSQDEGEAKSE